LGRSVVWCDPPAFKFEVLFNTTPAPLRRGLAGLRWRTFWRRRNGEGLVGGAGGRCLGAPWATVTPPTTTHTPQLTLQDVLLVQMSQRSFLLFGT
jgi:hypothetical protein